MEVAEAIRKRRAVRTYTDRPVDDGGDFMVMGFDFKSHFF